ncbi:MAG TPA: endonuclease/exonuclease/phosphatase family protein [Thermoanaerobaculia bacterium]|nr:endonuclease/exonuclease/phosphatase family protein [Thermoanaerobaculia bacterium]
MKPRRSKLQPPRWIAEPQWLREPLDNAPLPDFSQGLRLLTLNVAHGRKLATHQALLNQETVRRNLQEIAEVIGMQDADVVALQEADGPSAWSGNFDHVERLAELTSLGHHFRGEHNPFALGRANLASGTALLGRLPLVGPHSHRFGSSWRDTKGFVVATVPVAAWGGLEIDVVSLHLEPFLPTLRRQQIVRLTDVMRYRSRPLVVMGDFNCSWCEDARQLQPLAAELGLRAFHPYRKAPTYPARRPWRRLDWILVSPELEFAGYHTLPNPVSDHLAVVADVRLGVAAGKLQQSAAEAATAALPGTA